MSHLENTQSDLLDAIADPNNNVVALVGRWGVGKTFLWEKTRREHGKRLQTIRPNYAYVSLFGLSNTEAVRDALFSQFASITIEDASRGQKSKNALAPYIDQIQKVTSKLGGLWKVGAEGVSAAIQLMKLNCIRDMVVCFDDFERVANDLKAVQIMGLINELTTQRNCKVLLILNDEKLGGNREDFEEYQEKVIDKTVRFEPPYSHALEVAVPEPGLRALMEPYVKQLGCQNIRVVRRMYSTIQEVARRTELPIDAKTPGTISAICLLIYCHLVRGKNIPSIEDVLKIENVPFSTPSDPQTDMAAAFLRGQNWAVVEKQDRLIGDLISQGKSNWSELKDEIIAHSTETDRGRKEQENRELWREWRSRFRSNAESSAFATKIMETISRNMSVVNAREIDEICYLLKSIRNEEGASTLLEAWKEEHRSHPEAFDLSGIEIFGRLKNEDFRQYLATQPSTGPQSQRSIAEILTSIQLNSSWGGEDFRLLTISTISQYAESFRGSADVSLVLKGWFTLVNSDPISPESIAIFKAGKAALEQLAGESPASKILAESALGQVRPEMAQAAQSAS